MTVAAELVVEIKGREVGLEALLKKIEQRLRDLDAAAQKSGTTVGGGLSAAQARAATTAARLATETQKTAQAAQRNATEQQRTAVATAQAAAAQARAEQAALRLAQAQQRVADASKNAASFTQRIGDALAGSFTSALGPIALVSAGLGAATAAVNSFANAFTFKAQLDATTASINVQLKGVRDQSRAWSEGQAFANRYKLTQNELTQAMQASIGVMRNSTSSTTDLLTNLSRLQVLAPEKPIQEAARALRELQSGDTTSIKELFNISARDANRMKEEIIGGADAVQVLGTFLDQAGIGMDALATKTTGAMGAMKDLAIAQEELTLAQAEFAQGPGLVILNERIEVTRGLTRLLSGDFAAMGQSIVNTASEGAVAVQNLERDLAMIQQTAAANSQTAAAGLEALKDQILEAAAASPEAADGVLNMAAAVAQGDLSVQNFQVALAALITHQQAVAAASQQSASASIYQSQAMIEASNAAQTNTAAMVEQTQKTLAAKLEAEQLAAFQATLARIGGAVAAGHLTAAQGASQLAAQYGYARDQAYALIQAQAQLAGIQASGAATAADGVAQHTARLEAQGKHYKAIRDAQEAQVASTGSAADKQALLNRQLERARVTYGQQSVEFIRAETALKQYQQQQESAAKRGGCGGGKGAGISGIKLSDQQKLNNQLFADEQRFNNKMEDEELNHAKRRLDIERDFAKKMADAQRQFQLSRLDSEASFYDSLGQLTDHGLQQAYSAEYEAALLEAEALAREKGADVGQAYMQAKEAALKAESQRAQEIATAEEEGDAAKAEYLRGVDAKYQAAEDRRVELAKQGDDSIASQREQALTEEGKRYEEATGKVAEASARARDAQIADALRAGKAVEAEALQVNNLAQSYENLNRTAGVRAGGTGTPQAPTSPLTAPQTSGGAPVDLAGVVSAIQALQPQLAQLVALAGEEVGATREVSSTLRGMPAGKAFG
jgi:hypothetical protein